MKFTPGPWETIKSVKDRRTNIIQAKGGMLDKYQIAKVKSALECDQQEAYANAKLIAAAPDLMRALKDLCNEINLRKLNVRKDFSLMNAHAAALKSIKKAE